MCHIPNIIKMDSQQPHICSDTKLTHIRNVDAAILDMLLPYCFIPISYYWLTCNCQLSIFSPCFTGLSCNDDPAIANMHGSMSCADNNTHNATCTLVCANGFTKSGDLTCTNGTWDDQTCNSGMECVCTHHFIIAFPFGV